MHITLLWGSWHDCDNTIDELSCNISPYKKVKMQANWKTAQMSK